MTDRAISYVSLGVALAAIAYAGWLHTRTGALAEEAVRTREKQLVEHWMPKVNGLYQTLFEGMRQPPQNPQTLPELIDPLFLVFQLVGEAGTRGDPDGSADRGKPSQPQPGRASGAAGPGR